MQQLIRSSFEQSNSVRQLKYRAHIDGLRALAVLSVVGFHAFPDWEVVSSELIFSSLYRVI